jgi:uracil-DNA glycosylase
VDIIRPEAICALGSVAVKGLLRTTAGVTRLRGKFAEYRGIPVLPTFHPAYLLRNPEDKKLAWDDLRKLMEFLALPLPEARGAPRRNPGEVD